MRIEAFQRAVVGSPGISRLPRIKSYALLGRSGEFASESTSEDGDKFSSDVKEDKRVKESSLSLPLDAANSLKGRIWKSPDRFSTKIECLSAYIQSDQENSSLAVLRVSMNPSSDLELVKTTSGSSCSNTVVQLSVASLRFKQRHGALTHFRKIEVRGLSSIFKNRKDSRMRVIICTAYRATKDRE